MQNEIAAGLHNALERGEPLEHAIQTFVNAGYNPQEVQAAAQILVSEGVSSIIATSDTKVPQKPKNVEDNAHTKPSLPLPPESTSSPEKPKERSKLILIIGIVLGSLVLLGVLGTLVWLLL